MAFKDDLLPWIWNIPEGPNLELVFSENATVLENKYIYELKGFKAICDWEGSNDKKNKKENWIHLLPNLKNLLYLQLGPKKIDQDLFECVCNMFWLKRLYIEGSNIEDLSSITDLRNLTHLYIGSSPRLKSFGPVGELSQLISLGLVGNFQNIHSLNPLSKLTELKGLKLNGQDYKCSTYDSLNFLNDLINLRYLAIIRVKFKDTSFKSLYNLNKLKYFSLVEPYKNSKQEYIELFSHMSKLDVMCEELKKAATDIEFQKKYVIK